VRKILLRAQIPSVVLNRCMSKKQLDLFQIPPAARQSLAHVRRSHEERYRSADGRCMLLEHLPYDLFA